MIIQYRKLRLALLLSQLTRQGDCLLTPGRSRDLMPIQLQEILQAFKTTDIVIHQQYFQADEWTAHQN